MFLRQYFQTLILSLIYILKLIHQNELISILPEGSYLFILRQELIAEGQHIVKVHFFMAFLISFICTIQFREFLPGNTHRFKRIHTFQLTVHQRKLTEEHRNIFLQIRDIPFCFLQNIAQHSSSFFLLKNLLHTPAISASQNAEKDTVECTKCHSFRPSRPFESLLHLLRCCFGECQRKDLCRSCQFSFQ